MVGQRYYTPNPFEVDNNGVPLAGAQLFFFLSGTSDLFATYSDVNLTEANPNPVRADANGRFGSVFLQASQAYNVQLWTAPTTANPTGSQIWSEDPVGPAAGGTQTDIVGIVGEIRAFAGIASAVPALWYLCFGQAVSRTTYSAAFAVLGTSWGAGDGSTTFNLPDLRGRGLFGVDNMGGTPAGRMTSGVSGISGITLGAAGGSQATQAHTHAVNDPTHVHVAADPGHTHVIPTGFSFDSNSGGGNRPPAVEGNANTTTWPTNTATTGITIEAAATGITNSAFGSGSSQNVPPGAMVQWMIYLGA